MRARACASVRLPRRSTRAAGSCAVWRGRRGEGGQGGVTRGVEPTQPPVCPLLCRLPLPLAHIPLPAPLTFPPLLFSSPSACPCPTGMGGSAGSDSDDGPHARAPATAGAAGAGVAPRAQPAEALLASSPPAQDEPIFNALHVRGLNTVSGRFQAREEGRRGGGRRGEPCRMSADEADTALWSSACACMLMASCLN